MWQVSHVGSSPLLFTGKLCPENGLVERDCFREAKLAVFDLMENKYVRFRTMILPFVHAYTCVNECGF